MSHSIASGSCCTSFSASENLFSLFLEQLSGLVSRAQDAKRVISLWLLASPAPFGPSGPAAFLSQARRLTARHLRQLDQLLVGLTLPLAPKEPCPALRSMLAPHDSLPTGAARADSINAERLAVVRKVSRCLGTACASAAETAMVLGRVDLAAVLLSWAAAWRDLRGVLAEGLTVRASVLSN